MTTPPDGRGQGSHGPGGAQPGPEVPRYTQAHAHARTRPRTRIACLAVPLFPLAARLRSEPELKGEPVAVFEGNGNAARVIAATRPARRAGIRAGMTLPQARAILPKLVARGRDAESERAAEEAILEIADAFSPRVEDAGEGVIYADLAGLPGLTVIPGVAGASGSAGKSGKDGKDGRGGTDGMAAAADAMTSERAEERLAQRLIAEVEKAGLPARVGIAGSKLAARVAASLPDSPRVVPEGEEARFLAPLPLDRLAPEIEIASRLAQWGIHSAGELARLPEGEVASRLGELGRELHETARGLDPRPLEPRVPALLLSEGMDLEWPLVALEPFLFVGHTALERLVGRLESQALACTRLEVTLKLDPDGVDARAIALPAPTRDVKTLLTLLRLELEARPPGAPVAGFTFSAHPDKPRRAQLSPAGALARPARHDDRAPRVPPRRGSRRSPAHRRRPPPGAFRARRLLAARAAGRRARAEEGPRPPRRPRAASSRPARGDHEGGGEKARLRRLVSPPPFYEVSARRRRRDPWSRPRRRGPVERRGGVVVGVPGRARLLGRGAVRRRPVSDLSRPARRELVRGRAL